MSSEEDDVPPLEDMSHAFQGACAQGPATSQKAQSVKKPQSPASVGARSSGEASPSKRGGGGGASKASFGGMRSGFLTAAPERKPPAPAASKPSEPDAQMPFLRSNPEAASRSLRLDEVQESLARDGPLKDKSWINDDLLAKVESDAFLAKSLADPRMAAALTKFQKEPARAFQEYKDDEEVQRFLKAFSALLGAHFTSIADKQEASQPLPQPQPQTDPEVEAALSRPEVREALTDPEVQNWLALMRSDSAKAHAQLRANASPQFHRHLRVLYENGMIGVAK